MKFIRSATGYGLFTTLAVVFPALVACGGGEDGADDDASGGSSAGAAGTTGGSSASGQGGSSGDGGSDSGKGGTGGGSAGDGATGGSSGSGGDTGGSSGAGGASGKGGSGGSGGTGRAGSGPMVCGEGEMAFCDNFEAPAPGGPRTVDLDATRWSAARIAPQLPTEGECAMCAGAATIPACREGVGTSVFPDQDTLICDANADIASSHLLVAVASQNYGQNTYRIRQPFDFTGRTGNIVFDVEAYSDSTLYGWAAVEISEDPTPTPSFPDYEYGPLPRNGIQIEFTRCDGAEAVGVLEVRVFRDFVMTRVEPTFVAMYGDCMSITKGRLNHVEVALSRTNVEVWGSDVSPDGVEFGNFRRLFAGDIDLSFERGYVSITGRNHATIKYSMESGEVLDAWLVRWDNVGFDGPVVSNYREYSAPDSLQSIRGGEFMNYGYAIPSSEGSPLSLSFEGVDPSNAARARLAFSIYYPSCYTESECGAYNLRYRLNGGAWHDRRLDAAEIAALLIQNQQGCANQIIDVDAAELVSGTNTVEFATPDIAGSYPPALANLDLVIDTN